MTWNLGVAQALDTQQGQLQLTFAALIVILAAYPVSDAWKHLRNRRRDREAARAAEEAAGIAIVAEAGRRAWDLHKAAIATDGRTCATEGES